MNRFPMICSKAFIIGPLVADTHAFKAGHLPHYHGDPLDRMLIAQAHVESPGLYDVNV